MAKYIVNHVCGHAVVYQLFGKEKARSSRIAWLETLECEECSKAKANAASLAAKEKRGLADLTGSEKQIAWANTIREGAYKALDCLDPFVCDEKIKSKVDGWRAKMDAQTEAKWWIDKRFVMPHAYVDARSGKTDFSAAKTTWIEFKVF